MSVALGIDFGTTKTALAVVDTQTTQLLYADGRNHEAAIAPGIQDGQKHLAAMRQLLDQIPADLAVRIGAVGVTGQMHGVILWSRTRVSPLYTWQYQNPMLTKLRKIAPELCHGYGMATLAELAAANELDQYEFAGTIHDYAVWHLCGQPDTAVMDDTDAASWGLFDLKQRTFDADMVQRLGIPSALLPKVLTPGSLAGHLSYPCALTGKIPVTVAAGDNQCSVLATAQGAVEHEIYLTIGTGAQLSFVTDRLTDQVSLRPYFGGKYLAVAAPLCGGAAWALLQCNAKELLTACNLPLPSDAVLYDILDDLAVTAMDDDDLPLVKPNFCGERNQPRLRGAVEELSLQNCTPGKIAAAWALGIVRNLYEMMPSSLLQHRKHLLVSGNAVRKTRALQTACQKIFGVEPVITETREEAACGAALSTLWTI